MALLDLDIISELRMILEDDIHAVATQFAEQLHEQLTALQLAQAAEDFDQIKRVAHLLKGSAANLGATDLATAAATLERAAQHTDMTQITPLLFTLPELAQTTLMALRDLGINTTSM
ncbi:Hpt domain-containing protein [Thiospirillum jenense]|uniref:Hpt domain-containing protein n=1 Tax=Thiospirillum jenense TaxID=1653858 RepID=A0A839HKQ4_9GAMM|nr:Hpt domain-containing protein [Thiospirillum jenense]MBB1127177.1 Hpt domain-containing protein [Thiospirillum jenense]